MDKNHKKDIEQLLIKQTEKLFLEIDAVTTVSFSKNIKSYCKDLTKKFYKAQKKLKKQLEEIILNETLPSADKVIKEVKSKETPIKTAFKKTSPQSKSSTLNQKTKAPIKAAAKGVRKGTNLYNTAIVQKKGKASLVKNINKPLKK
jgi:hypothetical protein